MSAPAAIQLMRRPREMRGAALAKIAGHRRPLLATLEDLLRELTATYTKPKMLLPGLLTMPETPVSRARVPSFATAPAAGLVGAAGRAAARASSVQTRLDGPCMVRKSIG